MAGIDKVDIGPLAGDDLFIAMFTAIGRCGDERATLWMNGDRWLAVTMPPDRELFMPMYLYIPRRRPDPYTAVLYEGKWETVEAWLKYLAISPSPQQLRWDKGSLYVQGVRAEPDCYIGYDTNQAFSIWMRREFEDMYMPIPGTGSDDGG